jgi:hypothetical protein
MHGDQRLARAGLDQVGRAGGLGAIARDDADELFDVMATDAPDGVAVSR